MNYNSTKRSVKQKKKIVFVMSDLKSDFKRNFFLKFLGWITITISTLVIGYYINSPKMFLYVGYVLTVLLIVSIGYYWCKQNSFRYRLIIIVVFASIILIPSYFLFTNERDPCAELENLYDFYLCDFRQDGANFRTWIPIQYVDQYNREHENLVESTFYFDHKAHSTFMSFYIPTDTNFTKNSVKVCLSLPRFIDSFYVDYLSQLKMEAFNPKTGERTDVNKYVFTRIIYIYHEDFLRIENQKEIVSECKNYNLTVIFRGQEYALMQKKH